MKRLLTVIMLLIATVCESTTSVIISNDTPFEPISSYANTEQTEKPAQATTPAKQTIPYVESTAPTEATHAVEETIKFEELPEVAEETSPSTEAPAPSETPAETKDPVYVHENAVEDYLLPLADYSRERKYDPEFVMIHFISAVSNHREDPYNNKYVRDIFVDYNLSVHYLIQRDGTVHCYVPENLVAWHAGKGTFNGDPKYKNSMNDYAIGIELVAIGSESDMSQYLTPSQYQALDDSMKGYTDAQYQALSRLVADLCQRYDIPQDSSHVIGHEDYSSSKTDPGELFEWNRILP